MWKQSTVPVKKTAEARRVVSSMFNTVSGMKVAILGFAFKKDTRETPAISFCRGLLGDKASLSNYDPQVSNDQILRELTADIIDWGRPSRLAKVRPLDSDDMKEVNVVYNMLMKQ